MTTRAQAEYDARRALERQRRKERAKRPVPSGIARSVRSQHCRVCGHPRTEVHHIVPRSHFRHPQRAGGVFSDGPTDPHVPENLMPLCHQHHQDHHTQGKDRRVPRHRLRPEEIEFVIMAKGHYWLDYWYPR